MSTTTKPARVLLVDDHPAVIRRILGLVSAEFEVVEVLGEGESVEAAVAEHEPDLVVLDISLPGMTGLEVAARLRAAEYRSKIIFLTVHEDADYARAAFNAGALGYVVKPRLATDLLPALREALRGRRFVSPSRELEGL